MIFFSALLRFFKKQYVFCIASLCAVISCIFVPPGIAYFEYIDRDTLSLLFALMASVQGFESCGVFSRLGARLVTLVSTTQNLSAVLTALCFATSMFITNDVALLTFIPFSLMLFKQQQNIPRWILRYTIVLQTIAANTGSMLTPVGNPQNIFLFSKLNVSVLNFICQIAPYCALSAVLLFLAFIPIPKIPLKKTALRSSQGKINSRAFVYAALFAACLLCVAGFIPKLAAAPIIAAALLFTDRSIFFRIDWWLLLTFCAFFVFSGNIAAIPEVSTFLKRSVSGNEFYAAVISSQIISNVPSALLLYPFVSDARALLIGVNAGGLGTIVASLASLISFKLYAKSEGEAAKYIAVFSAANIVTLAFMWIFYLLFH